MNRSNTVFDAVLAAAGRQDVAFRAQALAVGRALTISLSLLEEIPGNHGGIRNEAAYESTGGGVHLGRDTVNDRVTDRSSDPLSGTKFYAFQGELNQRQRWFIRALLAAAPVKARDLQVRWQVSEKTARRDLAHLKRLRLIEFAGAFKNGSYRLCD